LTAIFGVQLLANPTPTRRSAGFRRSQPGKNLPVLVSRDTKAQKGFVDPPVVPVSTTLFAVLKAGDQRT
jgi:hypothetical protein